jgi:hypothetical protein
MATDSPTAFNPRSGSRADVAHFKQRVDRYLVPQVAEGKINLPRAETAQAPQRFRLLYWE